MAREKHNWYNMLKDALAEHGENIKTDVVASTFKDREIYREFDAGYGGSEGDPFTLWTEKRVYFPVVYDGAEWVGSAPRNPCDEKTEHQGGQ